MRTIVYGMVIFCGMFFTCQAFAFPEKPNGHVNDYAGMLREEVIVSLENQLRMYAASTTNEVAVVTVPDLGGESIEQYATKLFESWKIGAAKNDNGVLLLIARDERQVRIEVGYGLEGALPDILAKDIIDNQITPSFKQGDYNKGVTDGIHSIQKATQGEYQGSGNQKKPFSGFNGNVFELILFGIFFISQVLASLFARSKSWWAGGVVGGVIGGVITYFQFFGISVLVGLGVTAGLTTIGLLLDYLVSNKYAQSMQKGTTPPWWSGGSGFGGGSSGSSFGGFGGGSSGGGGASGRW